MQATITNISAQETLRIITKAHYNKLIGLGMSAKLADDTVQSIIAKHYFSAYGLIVYVLAEK